MGGYVKHRVEIAQNRGKCRLDTRSKALLEDDVERLAAELGIPQLPEPAPEPTDKAGIGVVEIVTIGVLIATAGIVYIPEFVHWL